MKRPIGLLALGLLVLPAIVTAADFKCLERAFDLTVCTDPTNLDTCPEVCTPPPGAPVCATLPLPELPNLQRQSAGQPILREVVAQEGPFVNVALTMPAFSATDDAAFRAGRNLLCVPAAAPTPPPESGDSGGGGSSGGGGGQGLIGSSPGLVGGNPGLIGGNPGIK